MILNLALVVILLAAAVLYAGFGLFSGFLQIVATLIAGALAFALWEPFAGLIDGVLPGYAAAIALVIPFAVFLGLIRYGLDKAADSDLKFPGLVDQLGGGLAGLVAGGLTLGVLLLGVQFLPLPASMLGYQPYTLDGRGRPAPAGGLWVPVDEAAANLYTFLSAGAFSSRNPLHLAYPDLHRAAASSRLAADVAQNQAAAADAVGLLGTAEVDQVPVELASLVPDGAQAFAAELEHDAGAAGGFDSDAKLRIPAYQATLLTRQGEAMFPIGFRRETAAEGEPDPTVYAVDAADAIAVVTGEPGRLTWFFAVPEGQTPAAIRFRNIRLNLDEPRSPGSDATPEPNDPTPPADGPAAAPNATSGD